MFDMKHLYGKRDLNCDINGFITPRTSQTGSNKQTKCNIFKIVPSTTRYMGKKVNALL